MARLSGNYAGQPAAGQFDPWRKRPTRVSGTIVAATRPICRRPVNSVSCRPAPPAGHIGFRGASGRLSSCFSDAVCCRCDRIVADRGRIVHGPCRAMDSPAASGNQDCADAADITVLPSPVAPWKGAPLRVMVVAEKPLDGALSLIAPDGSVAATSRRPPRRGRLISGSPRSRRPPPAPGTRRWRAAGDAARSPATSP